jgi:DNA-binding HxlR family transcriptional regulator
MRSLKPRSDCAISLALDIFGDKWALLIIRDLLFHDKHTYGDFLKSNEKIATNILADKLAFLEANGILIKQPHPESKAKNLYTLTPKGLDLLPILLEIIVWSDKYFEISARGKALAQEVRQDRTNIIEKTRQCLKASNWPAQEQHHELEGH